MVDALFCEKVDAHSYFLLVHGLVHHLGLPFALYTDRNGVFRHTPDSGLPGRPTQFSRAKDWRGVMAKRLVYAASDEPAVEQLYRGELSLVGTGISG